MFFKYRMNGSSKYPLPFSMNNSDGVNFFFQTCFNIIWNQVFDFIRTEKMQIQDSVYRKLYFVFFFDNFYSVKSITLRSLTTFLIKVTTF